MTWIDRVIRVVDVRRPKAIYPKGPYFCSGGNIDNDGGDGLVDSNVTYYPRTIDIRNGLMCG